MRWPSERVCVRACVLLFNKRNINRLFQINFPNPSFLSKLVAAFKHMDSLGWGWEEEMEKRKERERR